MNWPILPALNLTIQLDSFAGMINEFEKKQFNRHLQLPGFGEEMQLALENAHVMVVGLGGLGNPVAQYLAAGGIGKLTLVDFDRVEVHNLHRQLLFGIQDCGSFKAETAARKLKNMYPQVEVDCRVSKFDRDNFPTLPSTLNLIADCTDNFSSRYEIDRIADFFRIPVLFGAAQKNEGRLSLFHATAGCKYADLYPAPPISDLIGDCQEVGVLGPLVGAIGSMMTAAIFEFLTSGKSPLDGAMLHFDISNYETHLFQIQPLSRQTSTKPRILILDHPILKSEPLNEEVYELIDVRETFEHEEFNVGGKCLPAGNILEWQNQLDFKKTPLFYCNHGHQSFLVAQYIATRYPELQIAHLKNGVGSMRTLA